jgi:hypothetical protein
MDAGETPALPGECDIAAAPQILISAFSFQDFSIFPTWMFTFPIGRRT